MEMATDPTAPDRGRSPIQQAAEKAKQEVLSRRTLDVLLNTPRTEVIKPAPEAETIKGTAYRSGGWLYSPGNLAIFAAADNRLTLLSSIEGRPVKQVNQVQPELIKGSTVVIFRTAPPEDLTAIPVNRYTGQSGAWINLFTLLAPAGLTVPTGYKERYEIAWVPEESPFWPALCMDLSRPVERRIVKRKSAGQTEPDIEPETEAETETP